ncbi:hypothetical protein MHB42_03450 [Lysinibacillus sp. FSL K6-0232]|uniref:hypothetical protein n=1 Tax=Lysinibacillus sp. FSL K6-0232 TaxID=2921425 RepID=UPI0030F98923
MDELLLDTQQSYYDYVVKLQDGCQMIAKSFQSNNLEQAFQMIADFSEGLGWLVTVEQHMQANDYVINSRIEEVVEQLTTLNKLLENRDIVALTNLFQAEIAPLFASASEWTFNKVQN